MGLIAICGADCRRESAELKKGQLEPAGLYFGIHPCYTVEKAKTRKKMYYVYLLRCAGGSLYSGITTDLERRFLQHSGKIKGGAKYTAARAPLGFEAVWTAESRSQASRLEYSLKRLSHAEKESIVRGTAARTTELEGYERLF